MFVPLLSIGLAGIGAACSIPVLTANQIYQTALAAGFPDNPPGGGVATQMTAIALRESGGCPTALNQTPPDDSYGLWQINLLPGANPQVLTQLGIQPTDLFDPATNAAAAFLIYNGSSNNLNIAWGGNSADQAAYQANLPAAQAAALAVSGSPSSGSDDSSGSFLGLATDLSDSSSFAQSLGLSDAELALGGIAALVGVGLLMSLD